ncbi:MAG TPA: HAD family phosphatase [Candidatus Saccharimonadales bacterium]|nr:HAD family phosphatase [Candidatus Saccharimonadales bacterium]
MPTGRKFAVFDIDGTLIRWQLYHALVDGLVRNGHINPDDFPTIKESRMNWKNRQDPEAFKKYEIELVNFYNANLASLSVSDFNSTVDEVFDEYKDQVYVFTKQLIEKLRQKGYLLFAISGSQSQIVSKLVDYYHFDDFLATVVVEANGHFTGELILPHLNKDKSLRELVKKHKAVFEGSYAVGDSLGDAKMMELVDNPIAFNPERALFDYSKMRAWKVVLERKNMVYELEKKGSRYELAETNAG